MKLHKIIFSPTGGTGDVCEYLADGMKDLVEEGVTVDLCSTPENISSVYCGKEDLIFIAMPVFAGRVPAEAIRRLIHIKSNNTRCVAVAVYGNRAFDDALLELSDVITECGLRVIAAVGAVAEHSIIREYGHGRPDEDDIRSLHEFAEAIYRKVACHDDSIPDIPGNRPYRQPMNASKPAATDKCTACGICVNECPVGAISLSDIKKVDERKCISCMRCVSLCPAGARDIDSKTKMSIRRMLEKPCASRKNNELFI